MTGKTENVNKSGCCACKDLVFFQKPFSALGATVLIDQVATCDRCGGIRFVRNGRKKQNFKCKVCGKQSSLDPNRRIIAPETKSIAVHLLLKGIAVPIINEVTGISKGWLYSRKKQLKG